LALEQCELPTTATTAKAIVWVDHVLGMATVHNMFALRIAN
jgi:glucose-6-phosphate 1-dehydrogenase